MDVKLVIIQEYRYSEEDKINWNRLAASLVAEVVVEFWVDDIFDESSDQRTLKEKFDQEWTNEEGRTWLYTMIKMNK